MQPKGNRLVPSMLAAGAIRKMALVRNFCEMNLCNPNGSFIPPGFLIFYSPHSRHQYLSHQNVRFKLYNV